MTLEQRAKVREAFEDFLRNRIAIIRRLRVRHLDINPFLIRLLSRQLGLSDSKAIVRWMVNQRLERGSVTSLGSFLQEAAKAFSEGTGVEGADLLKTKQGRRYHIQVKSGPNTVPKDMANRITTQPQSARRRNRGSVTLLTRVMAITGLLWLT